MSPQISQEALLIVMSLYGGLVLAVCYDMVRVCRRIFKVGIVSMIIQDVIYWTISAIFMFNIYLKYNYGRPRFFSIIFTLGIMALYEWLVGRKIVDRVAKFLCKVKTKLSKMLKKLNTCVFGKVKKIVTKMLKPLQKLYKLDKLKRVKKEKRKRKWQQKTEKYQQEPDGCYPAGRRLYADTI